MPSRMALLMSLLCLGTACGRPEATCQPGTANDGTFTTLSESFISSGKGFRYAIKLKVNRPVNAGLPWFAWIDYEDPVTPSAHLIQAEEIAGSGDLLAFYSPVLPALKNHKKYSVLLRAYADVEMKKLITSHAVIVHLDYIDPAQALHLNEPGTRLTHPDER